MSVTAAKISQQIQADTHSCEQLLVLFAQEREALKTRDTTTLATIVENKEAHLSKLEQSAKLRFSWSKEHAISPTEKSWDTLVDELKDKNIKQKWLKLTQLFAKCKEENEVNGRLIARNQQVFGRLIEIIRGQTQAPSLYGSNGAASARGGSNRFGEA